MQKMKLVKEVGQHKKYLNLKTALQTYVPNFKAITFHTASGDVAALVALMFAIAKRCTWPASTTSA